MRGLYVHIPFCLKKCHYCDFVITSSGEAAKRGRFLRALAKEAAHHAPRFSNEAFGTLYIGGGTPSVLSADETTALFGILRGNFRFEESAEVTLEANPGDVTEEKASLYRKFGVNRVSLGAQSFSGATLGRLNRAHAAGAVFNSFRILRTAGFKNISLDLMLSLPGETLEDVENSLRQAVALGPEHVSLYELVIKEKTVFGREFRKGALKLPDEGTQIRMLSFARETLKREGFEHYELLNYAKPGFRSRHNLLYWANGEYLGLGPGGFSYLGGKRFRSSAGYQEYMNKIEKDDWTPREEETLSGEKREIESLLLSLRLTEGAALERFGGLFSRMSGPIENLRDKGLVWMDDRGLRLTARGRLFAETVFAELCYNQSDHG